MIKSWCFMLLQVSQTIVDQVRYRNTNRIRCDLSILIRKMHPHWHNFWVQACLCTKKWILNYVECEYIWAVTVMKTTYVDDKQEDRAGENEDFDDRATTLLNILWQQQVSSHKMIITQLSTTINTTLQPNELLFFSFFPDFLSQLGALIMQIHKYI